MQIPRSVPFFCTKSGATVFETVSGVASLQKSIYSRCLFSQRYKCMYKGKKIKLLKEQKIKTAAHFTNTTKTCIAS